MATDRKSLVYVFDPLTTLADNSLTALTQITIYIPEAVGSGITFSSVCLKLTCDDTTTATGTSLSTPGHTIQCSLNGGTATSGSGGIITNSGENWSTFFSLDATAHFNTNWPSSTGSATLDCSVLVNGATTGTTNACVTVEITYDYDTTSSTQIKTVYIPLDCPTTTLATSKPGTATATIPALDTWLPEASKTYRQISIVVQGNDNRASTTDTTLQHQIDTLTQYTSGNNEGGLNSARYIRYVTTAPAFDTSTTHSWYLWCSAVAMFNHMQAYMVVTYEYDESTTSSVMQSLLMPIEIESPMGGTTSADQQQSEFSFFIEEPGTISIQESALYLYWTQAASMTGLNVAVNANGFTSYTDAASTVCGSNALMKRCEGDITLARGKNLIDVQIYNTDTADNGWNVSGFFIINYTSSSKSTKGSYAHNKTIYHLIDPIGSAAASIQRTHTAEALSMPHTEFFINRLGVLAMVMSSGTTTQTGFTIQCERLSAEGGVAWMDLYKDIVYSDPEVGVFPTYCQARNLFYRYPGDPDDTRVSVGTARRIRSNTGSAATAFFHLEGIITYHCITFTVAGTVSGSGGGTVDIDIHRTDTGEEALATSRTGDGAYSLTWYDNTIQVYADAYEDSTHVGRSDLGLASGSP